MMWEVQSVQRGPRIIQVMKDTIYNVETEEYYWIFKIWSMHKAFVHIVVGFPVLQAKALEYPIAGTEDKGGKKQLWTLKWVYLPSCEGS